MKNMAKKIYELWFNDNEVALFDEENENVKSLFEGKMIVKFEAYTINEAIIKMNELLKIFEK